jgi:sugar lactone lactonase YvrE
LDRLENFLGETWVWNGVTWAQRAPAASPSARGGAAMAYDAASGQLILFGGNTGATSNETWTWTGTNWVQLHPATSPPPEINPAMAYDPAMGQIVIFGGDQGPPNRLFVSNQTWAWNGTTWTRLMPATVPPARADAAMGYDTATKQLVMYGGLTSAGPFSDTWLWNGSNWVLQSAASNPGPRSEMSLTYDATTSQLLLVAGLPDQGPVRGDIWSWTGKSWTQLIPQTQLDPRYLHYAGYDAANRELVVFGGIINGPKLLDDTWLYGPLAIPPQALAPATVGARYSAPLSALAGTPPETWSVTSGALPAGLSLSPSGVISGTPTTAGKAGFTVTAMDAESPVAQASRALSLTVNPPPKAALWVTDGGDNVIHSFPLSATGNARPSASIGGSLTGLNTTGGIVVDKTGAVYVSNAGTPSVTVYGPGAKGNVSPVKTIAGPHTGLAVPAGVALDSAGLLYVANPAAKSITVYAAGASGDAAPVQTISGFDTELNQPMGVVIDSAGHLWVANAAGNLLTEYAPGATGDAVPVGVFRGISTMLNDPVALAQDPSGRVLAANRLGESVSAFNPAPPFGNTAPASTISGSQSQLSYPSGLDVDNANNLYVANQFGGVNVYPPNSSTPSTVIAGTATGLADPHSVALAPPLTIPTTSLRPAAIGRRYVTHLVANLGTTPFRWRIMTGHLPRGLTLTRGGVIEGVPRRRGRIRFTVAVRDSTKHAMHDTRRLTLTVRRAPVVTSISPARGKPAGRTKVTIVGSGFVTAHGATIIAFGRLRALAVRCRSHTRCTVSSPPHAAGKAAVTATVHSLVSRHNRRSRYLYSR